MNALKLFRSGFDYVEIAAAMNTTEAHVERSIHELRERERMEAEKAAYADKRKVQIRTCKREYQRRVREENKRVREARV